MITRRRKKPEERQTPQRKLEWCRVEIGRLNTRIAELTTQLKEHGEILDALIRREEPRTGPVLRHATKGHHVNSARQEVSDKGLPPNYPGMTEETKAGITELAAQFKAQSDGDRSKERDRGKELAPDVEPPMEGPREGSEELLRKSFWGLEVKLSVKDAWVLYRLAYFPDVAAPKKFAMLDEAGVTGSGRRIGEALITGDIGSLSIYELAVVKRYRENANKHRLLLPSIKDR